MVTVYGPLHLSMKGVIGLAIVAILTLVVAWWLLRYAPTIAGLFIFFGSSALLIIVLITAWTSIDLMHLNVLGMAGARFGSLVIAAVWVITPIHAVNPKQKPALESHG
jgi:hypothetical protein